ncbi:hypothetical protein PMAYCL1PPCAC_00774, partial [Pristionchus mayeri]
QRISARHNHQMMYRTLTAQMMLPLGYMVGACLWMLDVTGVVHSRQLHQAIFIFTKHFAFVSPLINMYYIPPYKR